MTAVFADTSFYIAFHNRRDAAHTTVEFAEALGNVRIVTTEFVLLEVANFFTRPGDRDVFVALESRLRADPAVEIIPASASLFAEGLALFAARRDQEWSLTDCISFTVLTAHGLTDALTADHHFAQAGFRPLLVP